MRPAAAAAAPPLLTATVFLVAFLGLLLEAACLPRPQRPPHPSSPLQGGGFGTAAGEEAEEKVWLGSSPPSCRGKCYECSPCTAVQVPTLSAAPSRPAAAAAAARGGAARGGALQQLQLQAGGVEVPVPRPPVRAMTPRGAEVSCSVIRA
ncbi:hypothetical protein ACP70R_001065 [Stipagrostis hirtigluma subsp. patula]